MDCIRRLALYHKGYITVVDTCKTYEYENSEIGFLDITGMKFASLYWDYQPNKTRFYSGVMRFILS